MSMSFARIPPRCNSHASLVDDATAVVPGNDDPPVDDEDIRDVLMGGIVDVALANGRRRKYGMDDEYG